MLTTVSLPESLTLIESWGFGYCQSLKAIILPDNVKSLGQYAFLNCSKMRWLECLPPIPPECGVDFLTYTPEGWIVVPDGSVQGYKAAEGWKDYSDRIISRSEVDSPAIEFKDGAVKAICVEKWDFNYDGELSEKEAATVKSLDWAFYQNPDITSFEELAYFTGLTEIHSSAFRYCDALERIVVPEGVTTIGNSAFYNCQSLRRVVCLPETPPECGSYFLRGTPEGWIIVPDGCVEKYQEADGWKEYLERITIAEGIESPAITFKDAETKEFCIEKWDRDGDGELSEREAASVRNLGSHNAYRTISSFDELVYFTGLSSIPSYCFYQNKNLKSIKLPPNLKEIEDFAFYYSGLQCDLELPEGLNTIGRYAFYNCSGLEGPLVLPESLTSLGVYVFYGCSGLSGDLAIPAGLTEIPDCAFYSCDGMKGTLTLHKGIKSIGSRAFYHTDFSRVDIMATEIPELGNNSFEKQGCLIYVPKGKATEYQEAEGWKSCSTRITEEGHLPKDFFYSSTDYSRDGEVVLLQKATKGKGINIIFLGDGFVDRDMAPGGKYETLMRRWMEQFFVYEPYTTFREWFNIYTVKVVSKNYLFGTPDSERRLTRDVSEGEDASEWNTSIATINNVCQEYARMVPNPTGQGMRIAVFMNTEGSEGRSFCYYGSSGYCMGFIFDCIDRRPSTLNHEIGGHGFAWLGDEYVEYNEPYPNPKNIEDRHNQGFSLNLDWRNNPSTVRWAHYLEDPRYADEGLGVFEGAWYATGMFRATMNSMMRYDFQKGAVFNAPSREAIYRNIMRFGSKESWTFDYETFAAIDEDGRKQAAEAYATYPPNQAQAWSVRKDDRDDEDFKPGLPPIMIDENVKEIIVHADGTFTIVR
jgi:hypothetical protein